MTRRGTEAAVESRLLQKEGHWLIYDVLIENISLVSNYRTQFDGIIKTSSYAELVKKLKARTP